MAIELIDWTDGDNRQAASTSFTVHESLQAGDLLGICIAISTQLVTVPDGWILAGDPLLVATSRRIYWLLHPHAGASEPASWTFPFSSTAHHSATPFGLRGADIANPVDVAPVGQSGTSGASCTAPDITTLSPGAMLLNSWHKFALTASRTLSLPGGMTSIGTGSANGSQGQCYRVACELRPTQGPVGARVSTSNDSANAWGCSSLSIRAAADTPAARGQQFLGAA